MKNINKIFKNNTEYQLTDTSAQQSISNIAKALDELEIPDKTSDLINDSGFITETDGDNRYASKEEVEELKPEFYTSADFPSVQKKPNTLYVVFDQEN